MGEKSLKSVFGRLGVAALAAFSASGAVMAQEPEEAAREAVDRDLYEAQRDLQTNRYRDGRIPFEQILSAPENVQLNIDYARQQIAAGDLKEAGATLERILLLNPTYYDVRVLYGLVLYRLGLYDRARYELELALESGELPGPLAAEAETYLKRIRYEQRPTRGALTITTGVDYETNRNQSPTGGEVLFSLPNPFDPGQFVTTTLDANPKVDDFAFVVSAQGRLQHDLGTQEGSLLHADVGFYHSDKMEVDNLDLDVATLAVGGTWYSGNWSFTPRVRGGFYWLDGDDYLATYGGDFEVAYRWTPRFTTYANARGEYEDFRDTSDFGAASERTGRRISGRLGATWRFTSSQKLTVEGLYADKNGEQPYESYNRYGVHAQHSWLLGRGAFSMVGVWAENSSYDGPDNFITPLITRDEWLYRGRFTLGAPISFFAPGLPEAVKDITLIAQYEYETVDSNIINFDYKTHKAAFLISKRIAFQGDGMKQTQIASMFKTTVAAAALVLFAAPVMAAECFDEDTDDPKAGNATAVVGPEVGVSRSSRSGVFRPESGDDMFSEDYVRTGDDSHLQLKLCDWSTYSFSPNSESAINEFYDASGAGRRRVVNFVRGGVRYSSGRDTEPGSTEVEIQDSGVTMGVRGTNVIVVEIDGFVYALLEGPLRDNSGLSPKGLVDFWTDENRDQIEASLKRPGWVVRIGPDGISEPYRADEELLKKIYDAFLPVIPEGDGDEQDYAGDPLNESGQGTQEGDDGQQHVSKRGLQKNSDTEYYPERPFGVEEGEPGYTVPVGDILPLDLLDDYAGLQTSPSGNLFVIAPAELTVGTGSSPITQDGIVMFQIAIDWTNRTIAPEALASFVKFDFTVTDPDDLTQRSMTGIEPSPDVIEAFLEAQLASAGVPFMLGEGGLSTFDTPAYSLTVRQGENGSVTVDVSSEFEGSDPNNTPYILAGGADDVLLTPGTGDLAYFSYDLADTYTHEQLDMSGRGSVTIQGQSTNVISTLGAPTRLTGWSVAQVEVNFANRTIGGGSSFIAVSAGADAAIGGDNTVQYVALDQAAAFDTGLFGLSFYTLASLTSDPAAVAGEVLFGSGDGVIGDVAAIIEDGEGNHLYTEAFLSQTSFNVEPISTIAALDAVGVTLGGGVYNFDGGFDFAQVQRADGGFSTGDVFAGIDINFGSRTVGGGDSYVEIFISDPANSYTFNNLEFISAVSFDDAANGAGVFGFGADEFSGSNIENALFLIRDGVGGAGETADLFFNFQDGMGGEGVGVIEEMTRQSGATDYQGCAKGRDAMKRRIFGPRLAGVIGAALALAMVFYEPALIDSARDRLFDQFQRLSPRAYDSAPVRVVEIDDAALEKYGQWPWPRHRLATIVDRLNEAGAAAIVLDIILAEPDRTSPVNVTANWLEAPQLEPVAAELSAIDLSAVDHDSRLAASLASAPTVLHLTARAGASGGACPAPLEGAKIGGMAADELARIAPSFRSVVPSLPQFRAAASGEGFARTGLSNDAVVRGAPMVALACEGKEIYPGLAIEALRVAAPRLDPQLAPRGFKMVADRPCRAHVKGVAGQSISQVSLCGLHIPTTADGELWVHYAAPDAMAARRISVVDILEGDADAIEAAVKGRVVMIGASAEGLRDVMVTPLGDERPGVHIHAEIIEQVLSGKTLFRAWDLMRPIEIAVAGFVVLLLLLFLPRMTAAAGFAVWLALAAALFGGAFAAFTTSRLLIDPVAPGLVLTLSFLGAFVVLFQQEQIARRFIRGAFGKFLSPLILERLERDPGLLKLEGEIREITAFFSDIRGFTTISHSLSAVQVTSLLNQYFTEMTKIVTDHNGLVDKYMGDGMAAMWNAPIDVANHPGQAARAALAMLKAVDKLNAEWRGDPKHGLPEISIGIGLHTDEAQVGNFGSEDHLEYSMLGDMVNLTSRLEALNKVYAAPIIISAATQARIPDFAAVPLGRFTAAGRSEVTEIYALAGDEALARRPAFQTFTETFAAGLAALDAGDGAAARRYFGALKQGETFGLSGAIDVFLARAEQASV